jgi:hypothetical protein
MRSTGRALHSQLGLAASATQASPQQDKRLDRLIVRIFSTSSRGGFGAARRLRAARFARRPRRRQATATFRRGGPLRRWRNGVAEQLGNDVARALLAGFCDPREPARVPAVEAEDDPHRGGTRRPRGTRTRSHRAARARRRSRRAADRGLSRRPCSWLTPQDPTLRERGAPGGSRLATSSVPPSARSRA